MVSETKSSVSAATDGLDFRDTSTFYRFTADDVTESHRESRKGSLPATSRADFLATHHQSCITLTVSVCVCVCVCVSECMCVSGALLQGDGRVWGDLCE